MFPKIVLALLTDSSGRVLLVRRKDSLLWSLPGSALRSSVASRSDFLAVCCRRQIGVTPDFVAPLAELVFSEQSVALGVDGGGPKRAVMGARSTEQLGCSSSDRC